MSTVDRLAEKWSAETGEHFEEPILKSDARWWLQAVAEELERSPIHHRAAAWLRQESERDE